MSCQLFQQAGAYEADALLGGELLGVAHSSHDLEGGTAPHRREGSELCCYHNFEYI